MAKLKFPFFSLGAHGTFADVITIQDTIVPNVARMKPIPSQPNTRSQLNHRYLYAQACQYFLTHTIAEKEAYKSLARPGKMTALAYFIRQEFSDYADLVNCLPLDENTGHIAHDMTHHRNDFTVYGASWVPGFINSGLYFDGIDDRLRLDDNPTLRVDENYCIEFWMKTTQVPPIAGWIWMKWNGGGTKGIKVFLRPDGFLQHEITDLANTKAMITDAVVNDGAWHHLICMRGNGRLYIIHNNVWKSVVDTVLTSIDNNFPIHMSTYRQTAWWYEGIIDEYRLYLDTFTTRQALYHYERRGARQ